jgi:serine/threonine-protein kinase
VPTAFEDFANPFGDRYRIERKLGRGGYAVVYLAHDLKYDRDVATTVRNPELALGRRTERFLREIQIAAKLSHRHIRALLDSGEADGLPHYVSDVYSLACVTHEMPRQ